MTTNADDYVHETHSSANERRSSGSELDDQERNTGDFFLRGMYTSKADVVFCSDYTVKVGRAYVVKSRDYRRYRVACPNKQCEFVVNFSFGREFRPPMEFRRHTCDPIEMEHASYDARRALKPQSLSRNKVVRQFVVDNVRKASPRVLQDILCSSGLDVSYHNCADAYAIVKSKLFQSDRLQLQLILSYVHEMNKRGHRADINFDGTTRSRAVVVYQQGIQVTSEFSDHGLNMDETFMKRSSGGILLVACLRNSKNEIHIVTVAWTKRADELAKLNQKAVEGMEAVDKTKWAAAYSPCARFGTMTTKNVDSVNSALMAARREPLLDCLMTIEKYVSGKLIDFTGKMIKWGQLIDYAEKVLVGKRLARVFDGMKIFSQCSSSFNVKVKRGGQLSTEYAIDLDKAFDPCSFGYFQYMDARSVHVVASRKNTNNLSILREFIGTSWTTTVYKKA
uniref:AlNc14C152G7556 protein n=1 Tax=Albugo laibachii Nc14 TaxID=890382 RepID=F0WM53_9STRA|nr:AlNc14C152G7556 [Albugo laibachii Nc14]|eukprot:CCA22381.1 AlNc14C152G7556 [Albugo laibachii Nc14]